MQFICTLKYRNIERLSARYKIIINRIPNGVPSSPQSSDLMAERWKHAGAKSIETGSRSNSPSNSMMNHAAENRDLTCQAG